MRRFTRSAWLIAVLGLLLTLAPRAYAVQVTFQVNLEVQTALGNFDASSHTVEVHGSFDGWGAGFTLTPSATDANLYVGATEVAGAAGSAVQYKFVINQAGSLVWENNGVGPNGAQNREFNVPEAALTLPVVHFNNQATLPGVVAVTFQVNLSIQQAMGNFDPAAHTVEVRGSFDGWGTGLTLEASPTDAGIYLGTTEINGSAGAPFEYKFVINKGGVLTWEGNVGPGGPNGNRTFVLAESPQVLPVVYFDNLSSDPGAGIPVTFQVDMAVQIATGAFDPLTSSVVVAGPFNEWSPTATPLANSTATPTIYSGVVRVKNAPASSVLYKFVMNGSAWEGGDNRAFTLAGPEQTLPVVFFNRVDNLGTLTISPPSGAEVTLTWTAGPGIRLQRAAGVGAPWQEIPESLGAETITFTLDYGSQIFRLTSP